MALSYGQVYQLARDAGLGKQAAITATAIASAESGRNPTAVGDTSLTDAKWGPSIGLWQIRSLHRDNGTGRSRDGSRLRNARFNARAMVAISGHGSDWGPWSVYNSGAYRSYLPGARAAADGDRAPSAPTAGGARRSDWTPLPGDDGLPGYADDLLGGLGGFGGDAAAGAAGEVAEAVGARLLQVATSVVPYAAALTLGVVLIGIGAWRSATA